MNDRKLYAIYDLFCFSEQKHYIGKTGYKVFFETANDATDDRFKEHASEESLIGDAIRRYGRANFVVRNLRTGLTKTDAERLEHLYIIVYDSLEPNGYNQRP